MSTVLEKKQSSAESYRRKKRICEMIKVHDTAYYICPRCNVSLDRDFQAYCDRCGQHLDWIGCKKAKVIYPGCKRKS